MGILEPKDQGSIYGRGRKCGSNSLELYLSAGKMAKVMTSINFRRLTFNEV